MLRTVKGQGLVLLGWETFVSVFLYFHSTRQNPPKGFSLGSSLTLWLINGSWRCPVISSPNNKLQPQMEVPLRPTVNISTHNNQDLGNYSASVPTTREVCTPARLSIPFTSDPISAYRQMVLVTQCIKFIQRHIYIYIYHLEKPSSDSTRYHFKVIPKPWEKKMSGDGLVFSPFGMQILNCHF